jgi:hypothetical protein
LISTLAWEDEAWATQIQRYGQLESGQADPAEAMLDDFEHLLLLPLCNLLVIAADMERANATFGLEKHNLWPPTNIELQSVSGDVG